MSSASRRRASVPTHIDTALPPYEAAYAFGVPQSRVTVAAATVPAMGRGLFVSDPVGFRCGETITVYAGEAVWNTKVAAEERDAAYMRTVMHGFLAIDGLRTPTVGAGAGSFANDPIDATAVNAKFVVRDMAPRVEVVATRDLVRDEEVYVSYGKTYWLRGAAPTAMPAV